MNARDALKRVCEKVSNAVATHNTSHKNNFFARNRPVSLADEVYRTLPPEKHSQFSELLEERIQGFNRMNWSALFLPLSAITCFIGLINNREATTYFLGSAVSLVAGVIAMTMNKMTMNDEKREIRILKAVQREFQQKQHGVLTASDTERMTFTGR